MTTDNVYSSRTVSAFLAQAGDIVIVTGKGGETKMAVQNGKLVNWDDREELQRILGV
ncbi:MAG: hypothetical protein V1916_02290 [Patescibacteria group bacterium]